MRKYLLLFYCTAVSLYSSGQGRIIADSGTFILHKFENPVGKETYNLVQGKNGFLIKTNFKLTDRGDPVNLNAELKLSALSEPLGLNIKGKTSSNAAINDTIIMRRYSARIKVDDSVYTEKTGPFAFPIAGYAPGSLQQELLKYWKNHQQPKIINCLPAGRININRDGSDTFILNHHSQVFDRYIINGLVWGNEFVWADKQGRLIGLVTNDDESDKFELMREHYEGLLSEMIKKTAIYGTTLLAKNGLPEILEGITVVSGGTLVDVSNGKETPNSVIILKNGLIKVVGTVRNVRIPSNAKIINAKGKRILPGLWDMHSHFGQAEWGPAYLAAGVTTVRDCTDEFDYIKFAKDLIDKGNAIGPHILKAGLIDGKGTNAMGIVQIDTKSGAISTVKRYKDNGYAQIKIYSSVNPATVKNVCDEAHAEGLTVTGHIPDGMNLMQAIDSGMDMVNHIHFVWSVMKHNKNGSINFEDSLSKAVISFISHHQVVIDPTIGSMELEFKSMQDNITQIEPAFYTLPMALQSRFKNIGMKPSISEKYNPMYQSMVKLVKVLYDAGVPIVAGSDQGLPGYSLDRELEIYVQAGLTPLQAIQSATTVPAKAMKMENMRGTIKEGNLADLIIVDGDPLSNISDIRKVSLVICGERIYEPIKMRRLVGFSK